MSAYIDTEILAVNPPAFLRSAQRFMMHPHHDVAVRLMYQGGVVREWRFFCKDPCDEHSLILRRPYDEMHATAEFVRVTLIDGGREVRFFPRVVIETEPILPTNQFFSLRNT